ncbi:MAG: DHH family phosphoesterase, partial [Anaerolineae bacterium]
GLEVVLAYRGIVGRAENRAMVAELDIPLRPLYTLDCDDFDLIALVDTQPGHGNQPFEDGCIADIVVDHHPLREATKEAAFWDVRENCAATSTIVTWYLRDARVRISPRVATALFYGIKTDTLGLARSPYPDDTRAYVFLQQRILPDVLSRIESASLSPDYYQALDRALHRTRIYDGLVVARLGEMRYPDMAAEVADFLRRLEDTKIVLTVGHYAGDVIVSLRAPERGMRLDELIQQVITQDGTAGGHDFMAAGRVRASLAGAVEETEAEIIRRFTSTLGVDPDHGRPLLR